MLKSHFSACCIFLIFKHSVLERQKIILYSEHKQGRLMFGYVRLHCSKNNHESYLLPFSVLKEQQAISSVSPLCCISELSGYFSYMALE